jgi:membrane protein
MSKCFGALRKVYLRLAICTRLNVYGGNDVLKLKGLDVPLFLARDKLNTLGRLRQVGRLVDTGKPATNGQPNHARHLPFLLSGMLLTPKTVWSILKETAADWKDSHTPRLGASLAYYTVFAIAPLFIITLAVAGFAFGAEAARHELFGQIQGLVGNEGGKAIESIVTAASNRPKTGSWATLIALATLLVASTGVFIELQDALNTIWKVTRKPGRGLSGFVKDRLLSFAIVLGIGFLLLVSLVLNATLSAFGKYVTGFVGEHVILSALNFCVSLGIITTLFAMIFKVLPDVTISWHDVWVGAFMTALLFNLGKFLLGFYLGRSSVTSAYGAAGSLVIVLLWVYYSAQILFFGAQFTRVYANRFGSHLRPVQGAHFVEPPPAKRKVPAVA